MVAIGIVLISMLIGQTIYAAQREERRLTRQYPSYNKRVKRVQKKVHRVTAQLDAQDFKSDPRGLVQYKLESAVKNRELPVESAELAAQIHGLKRLNAYVSGASNSSVGTKIAPVELEPVPVVAHADLALRPPEAPSLCSDCVIL